VNVGEDVEYQNEHPDVTVDDAEKQDSNVMSGMGGWVGGAQES
jgi:hypothetical protein